jgi:hypothetical protein
LTEFELEHRMLTLWLVAILECRNMSGKIFSTNVDGDQGIVLHDDVWMNRHPKDFTHWRLRKVCILLATAASAG